MQPAVNSNLQLSSLPQDATVVAYVAGVKGIQGALRLHPLAGAQTVLTDLSRLWLQKTTSPHETCCLQYQVIGWHQAQLIIQPQANNQSFSREQALSWRGAHVLVRREEFPVLPLNEYYQSDLLGFEVADDAGRLGVLAHFIDNGAQPVMAIVNDTVETLVPFVAALIKNVDLPARQIVVQGDWSNHD